MDIKGDKNNFKNQSQRRLKKEETKNKWNNEKTTNKMVNFKHTTSMQGVLPPWKTVW